MRLARFVMAALVVTSGFALDRPAPAPKQPPATETQAKNADAAARISRKEARMKQRDKEMDRRMKQKKN